MAIKKTILILGATGPTGILGVRTALDRGHNVIVYARNPAKLPIDLQNSSSIKIVTGELTAPTVTTNLFPLLATIDVVVSFLGPSNIRQKETPFLDFYRLLVSHCRSLPTPQRPYLVILSTVSITSRLDSFSVSAYLIVALIRVIASGVYAELMELAKFWTSDEVAGLDWCVFRVPYLNDGAGTIEGGRAGYVGKDGWGVSVSKQDVATWAIKEAEMREWVGKMPAIFAGVNGAS